MMQLQSSPPIGTPAWHAEQAARALAYHTALAEHQRACAHTEVHLFLSWLIEGVCADCHTEFAHIPTHSTIVLADWECEEYGIDYEQLELTTAPDGSPRWRPADAVNHERTPPMIEAWDKYGTPTDPFALALECGCRQHPYERCREARQLQDQLRQARIWQALRGRRIQLAVEFANHLYDLRRSMRP